MRSPSCQCSASHARADAAHSRSDAERPERHSHAEHGNDENPEITIVPMLRVGMQFVTLRVTCSC
ncbi:hypothetical protein CXB39_27565 [Pseudomonas amygdali pv. morsprunorum]|nr:hypothetical protein CXB39_27565 [Pseudomonas amygdali pv. morsprunorum]